MDGATRSGTPRPFDADRGALCIVAAMPVIDVHAHAFPDQLARRAVSHIEGLAGVRAVLDGTVSSLLRSMDAAGIERSIVLSIATKPSQFDSILAWSRTVESQRIHLPPLGASRRSTAPPNGCGSAPRKASRVSSSIPTTRISISMIR